MLASLAITLISCSDKNDEKAYTRDGGYVYFGQYPQSRVEDAGILSSLKSQEGTLPTPDNSNGWTSYGYYAEGKVSDYMWYKDVTLGDARYRAVYFTDYRPYLTSGVSATSDSYQESNGYESGKVYWFRFENIKWRVLKEEGGKALLLCESIIDAQAFCNEMPSDKYANSYESSSVRKWLNGSFYDTAFNSGMQEIIVQTTVDNSPASTGYRNNAYACANTNDKVFLLSAADTVNAAYGFDSDETASQSREKKGTQYAMSQGLWVPEDAEISGQSWWLLRSPDDDIDHGVRVVNTNGTLEEYYTDVLITHRGIVPALWINL